MSTGAVTSFSYVTVIVMFLHTESKKRVALMHNINHSTLMNSNADLPELLCSGLIMNTLDKRWPLMDDGHAYTNFKKRLMVKIVTMAAYRRLSKDFRVNMDKMIIFELKLIRDLAVITWESRRAFEYSSCRTGPETPEKAKLKKSLINVNRDAVARLNAKMELFFPHEVVTEYVAGVNSIANAEASNPFLRLHSTVSMFFCMATHKCYLHTCGGWKPCSKTHKGSTFTSLRFFDTDGKHRELCVYSGRQCVSAVCENKRDVLQGNMSYNARVVVEMYRRRTPSTLSVIKELMSPAPLIKDGDLESHRMAVVCNPKLIFTNTDICVPSVQAELGVSDKEVQLCKVEVDRKIAQGIHYKERVAEIQKQLALDDVDAMFSSNPDYFFSSLSHAAEVFPGACAVIKRVTGSIRSDTKHCLECPMIGQCFEEIKFFMRRVRPADMNIGTGMASREAYDFMSGKSAGIAVSNVDWGAAWVLKGSNTFDVGTVCYAMRLFDNINHTWRLTWNDLKHPANGFTLKLNTGEIIRNLEGVTYSEICRYCKRTLNIQLPALHRSTPVDSGECIRLLRDVYKKLAKSPKSKCMAMLLLGIDPTTLLLQTSKNLNHMNLLFPIYDA